MKNLYNKFIFLLLTSRLAKILFTLVLYILTYSLYLYIYKITFIANPESLPQTPVPQTPVPQTPLPTDIDESCSFVDKYDLDLRWIHLPNFPSSYVNTISIDERLKEYIFIEDCCRRYCELANEGRLLYMIYTSITVPIYLVQFGLELAGLKYSSGLLQTALELITFKVSSEYLRQLPFILFWTDDLQRFKDIYLIHLPSRYYDEYVPIDSNELFNQINRIMLRKRRWPFFMVHYTPYAERILFDMIYKYKTI